MTLPAGARLGPYEILTPIGAGGMGEVYRARDTQLDRDVAIKILPSGFAADPERLARFEREAKALASLNHPNIAQIYGLEDANGVHALVMELVDGEDLSERIAHGAIPLADALPIARQIADALEAAHDRGIIHRDLKPANIKIASDGAAKVLDFGLAKAIDGSDASADPRNSPTMSMAGTRAGLILGTAAYMAPEQARGQAVDRRADIWAFGVVLFEMLAGKQAFGGETISDVLASVLKNDLDWSVLPPDLPPAVLALLRRCLDPDRRNRLRDIGEARVSVTSYLAHPDAEGHVAQVQGAPLRGRPPVVWALTTAALVIALGAMAYRGRAPGPPSMRFVVVPPHGVSAYVLGRPSIALSPDGSTLALVGLENGIPYLFVRGPGEFDARKVPGSEGAGGPAFSPTGRTVAYLTSTQLKTLPLDGSPAVHGTANDPRGVAWADENTLVYAPESIGGLREVSLRGGAARALTAIDDTKSERTHRWPHVLPGGRWVLFTIGTITSPDNYDESRIDAVDRTTGERRHVFQGASMVRYVPSGHLIFARAGSLFAVRFDPATLKVSGEPVSVLRGIGGDLTTGAAHVTSSDNGTFAYVPGDVSGGMRQLSWSDLKGGRASIHLPAALYNDVRVSPDGARMVVGNGTSGMADIWVYTFARGTYTRLTFTGTNATPVWSRDGRDIYFSSLDPQTAKSTIYKTSADGGRQPQEVASAKIRVYLKEISRDGTSALVDYIAYGGARSNIGRLPLRPDASAEVIVGTRADEYGAALSADGRFLAYNSDEGGSPQIYVLELAAKGGRWQISNAGGEEPAWAVDGKSIFYRIEDRLMSVPVDTRGTFQAGLPAPLFDGIFNLRSDTGISYQPHPDGRRLLMTRAADVVSGGTVRVITRWIDELKGIQ